MLQKETRDIYDLFELLELMETNGFMSKRKYLNDYVYDSYNFANDIYLEMFFGEGNDEEFNKYHEEVRRLLKIEVDDTVLMKVCW